MGFWLLMKRNYQIKRGCEGMKKRLVGLVRSRQQQQQQRTMIDSLLAVWVPALAFAGSGVYCIVLAATCSDSSSEKKHTSRRVKGKTTTEREVFILLYSKLVLITDRSRPLRGERHPRHGGAWESPFDTERQGFHVPVRGRAGSGVRMRGCVW